MQNNRDLYEKLRNGKVERHSVKKRDQPKLSADHYQIVDIVYDDEGKYVPHCFVCRNCSMVMVVHKEGGHSKLRTHDCVKHFLQKGEDDDDCYFLNKHFLTEREKKTLSNAFSKLLSVEKEEIRKMLPNDWETGSW